MPETRGGRLRVQADREGGASPTRPPTAGPRNPNVFSRPNGRLKPLAAWHPTRVTVRGVGGTTEKVWVRRGVGVGWGDGGVGRVRKCG